MEDIEIMLRNELRDAEYAQAYAESFINAFIATQVKVLREQRDLTQAQLGERIGTTQAGVSRIEDVNYSSWSIKTLKRLAGALEVRLRVSFEAYGTLPNEVATFNRTSLERVKHSEDPGLGDFRELRSAEVERDLVVLNRLQIALQEVPDIGAYRAASNDYRDNIDIDKNWLAEFQKSPGGTRAVCG